MLPRGTSKKAFFDPKNVIFLISNFDLCRGGPWDRKFRQGNSLLFYCNSVGVCGSQLDAVILLAVGSFLLAVELLTYS